MSNILYISMGSNFKWRQVHPKNLRGWRQTSPQCHPRFRSGSRVPLEMIPTRRAAMVWNGGSQPRFTKASKACENELQMKARCGAADNFKSRHCNGVVGEQDYHDGQEY